ncbi:MAG: DUF1559 domain-containing protein [Planctomycetota bacterium]
MAARGLRASGFTLIELLVTISIIALLMGLIVPAAAGAREAARGLSCQSNLKQIGTAWLSYEADTGAFPIAQTAREDADALRRVRWAWGGAEADEQSPASARSFTRPVNAYLDASGSADGGIAAEITRSPGDDGWEAPDGKRRAPWPELGLGSTRRTITPDQPVHEVAGTSYFANEWLYCRPGAGIGFFERDGRGRDSFAPGLGLRHAGVSTSDLILLGGAGWSDAARYTDEELAAETAFIWRGFWFGEDTTHFAFADGSVRDADLQGSASGPGGSVYLRPGKHRDPGDWKRADAP